MRFIILAVAFIATASAHANVKAEFWQKQRAGSNFFNEIESADRLLAAKNAGLEVARITFTKWKSNREGSAEGSFLIGDLDNYTGLVAEDLAQLKRLFDDAQKIGIKVVLTTLSLPGNRWRQHNGNKDDHRLWTEEKYQLQAIKFWRDLAEQLKGHPAVVGYNILNEPAPERTAPKFSDWYEGDYLAWCKRIENTPQDLNKFYARILQAIREVDVQTPVVVDTGFFATPWGIKCMKILNDPAVIYSFHMYEPYAYTYYGNKGKYRYPGDIPIGEGDHPKELKWNAKALSSFFSPIQSWQKVNNISSNQIYVAEFGVFRQAPGAEEYLKDLISIFNKARWHWGFYSFREDSWPGMDYELGTRSLPDSYWQAVENGEHPSRVPYYQKNPIFDAILSGIKGMGIQ